MNLGLDQLTDDQAVDLLQNLCEELAQRDGYVRAAAQQTILDEAEKLKVAKGALSKAVSKVRGEYEKLVYQDILKLVREGVAAGSIALLSADQEAEIILKADRKARKQVVDEIQRQASAGARGITVRVQADIISVPYNGGIETVAQIPLGQQAATEVIDRLLRLLG